MATCDQDEVAHQTAGVVSSQMTILKKGYLRKRAHNFSRDWGRRLFILTPNYLLYYHQEGEDKPRCAIPLISSSIKTLSPDVSETALMRFRLITPWREYLLEADGVEEAIEWVSAINVAIQTSIIVSSNNHHEEHNVLMASGLVMGSHGLVEELWGVDEGNRVCADCGVEEPTWTAINLGILLCIDCSGVHRSLGCQVSRVRSLEMDLFVPETLQVLKVLGNAKVNSIFEAKDAPSLGSEVRLRRREFAERKYGQRQFTISDFEGSTLYQRQLRQNSLNNNNGDVVECSMVIASPKGQQNSLPLFSPEYSFFESVTKEDVFLTARFLFGHSVDINLSDSLTGRTALHRAASKGQLLQVHFLLLNGADAMLQDFEGRIAGEIALMEGFGEVADHLAKYQNLGRTATRITSINDENTSIEQRIRKSLMSQ